MAQDFEIDLSHLERLMLLAPNTAHGAAKLAMHDALDDWVVQSRNIAPIDKGTLRREIKADGVTEQNGTLNAEVSSTAIEGDFNYAYYIHELDAGGKNVGGEHQYLDKSAEENKDKWLGWIEDEVESQLRGDGW